ncbi:protein unc-119 homolog B [Tachysurus ichikawai]
MSYSCTSTGNSQDAPSCNKKCGGGVNPASRSGTGHVDPSPSDGDSSSHLEPKEAMKVKKGCNTTDVGVPVTTEEELLANTIITPEDVLGLQKITESKWR